MSRGKRAAVRGDNTGRESELNMDEQEQVGSWWWTKGSKEESGDKLGWRRNLLHCLGSLSCFPDNVPGLCFSLFLAYLWAFLLRSTNLIWNYLSPHPLSVRLFIIMPLASERSTNEVSRLNVLFGRIKEPKCRLMCEGWIPSDPVIL